MTGFTAIMKIHTEAKFESAHRLSTYDGKCNRLHGHNWKVELDIDAEMLPNETMLFDFTILKHIVDIYDHKIILIKTPENLKITKSIPEDWIVWVPLEPTAENLAIMLKSNIMKHEKLQEVKDYQIKVKVWESDHAWAEI
jgi:6-pyruvoyltetrahydropterin/6-carboxytetrahydropterin synthase